MSLTDAVRRLGWCLVLTLGSLPVRAAEPLPGTTALTRTGDLAAEMVAGIDRYLTAETARVAQTRETLWKPNFTSPEAYRQSIAANRASLAKIIGITDPRLPASLEYVGGPDSPMLQAESPELQVFAVRWRVLPGIDAEGLLLEPRGKVLAQVVVIPDALQSPEMLAGLTAELPPERQWALRLAEYGCRVLVPTIINRDSRYSGNERMNRRTNISHREFIYRMAYEMGQHLIGYEVQKVLAAVDWFSRKPDSPPIAVIGHGDGGMLALFSGALDERIRTTMVSGYFGPRNGLFAEPIDRNVWNLLREFGDAAVARLILPRGLVVLPLPGPKVAGPPAVGPGVGNAAAPGTLSDVVDLPAIRAEFAQVESWGGDAAKLFKAKLRLAMADDSVKSLLIDQFNLPMIKRPPIPPITIAANRIDSESRMKRQFDQLVAYTQHRWRNSEVQRGQFWAKANPASVENWKQSTEWYRNYFWDEVMGKLPPPSAPLQPQSRQVYDTPKWVGYEVTLNLYPDVFASGYLLLPKDLKPGEKRPVVVCQHGLEGRPSDVCDPTKSTPYYHSFGAQLANLGYIVFAPQNPYIGRDAFRVLQRKANPLKLSLFSFIIRQHETILDWLATQPMVDANRIAFYGLSYGGKTAMRVPAILPRYCLSICSGDFNEWIGKNVSTEFRSTYMYTYEYEMPEFDLGATFNYAEMAYLIAPKPFMVERGHDDGVGIDEMVAWEYAKIRYLYANRLKIPRRTAIEFFVGGHEIHSRGTFDFLREHLQYPTR
ncbi:alpha/beta hydrolase family protein [Tuwongella immobilis]|uniref:Peptidase S9 prolyl oligopeptidase catalytic domain-containing protein n=1 Tax=Tuwongella immobilis TaxID=692036 RepID=A0A6C2YM00_9BACT|nr:hypothetical protein [Tuwongella immobilis]VIP02394.1 Uncharacterized protein OS=Blastopirellula marina DSM 3645 GN=DSM3645_10132 PE=4 SV=1 [Tuwongella immobilis]VTS01268.1 Uncharacterized protein OS=Blastopirellula marina DSM 3645 GN=DSM3645_10132 PE=4 SV=1 [Tuwongella immobilis]